MAPEVETSVEQWRKGSTRACVQTVAGVVECLKRAASEGVGEVDQADKSRLKKWIKGGRPNDANNTRCFVARTCTQTSLILEATESGQSLGTNDYGFWMEVEGKWKIMTESFLAPALSMTALQTVACDESKNWNETALPLKPDGTWSGRRWFV